MKPMLASNWDEDKVQFPVIAQPKIDGVRGLNINGKFGGRSLKPFKNLHSQKVFSHPLFSNFDGELACGQSYSPTLCRDTTSALNTIEGTPYIDWWVFDILDRPDLAYEDRHKLLLQRVHNLRMDPKTFSQVGARIHVVPSLTVYDMDKLLEYEQQCLQAGYEGLILRSPSGLHKQGRSTVKEGGLLRIKRFEDAEALVTGITEGNRNDNEAQTNELGRTFRTSHQENKVPNGMVGNLICKDLTTGDSIVVSAGKLSHDERVYYFQNQNEMIGKIIKYQHFVHGKKDKPRFPTFQSFRMVEDL